MKIIHCADIHLDSKMRSHLSKEQAKERKGELLNTFHRMVEYAGENDVEAVLIAGDLFDSRKISVTAINYVKNEIVAHPDLDFYYLQGNHDGGSFADSFEVLPGNLHVFDSTLTSYHRSSEIVLTGIELDEENNDRFPNELAMDVGKINILTLHGQIGEYKVKDKAEMIHLDALKNKGIDYLALGHVHGYCYEKLDARGRYCYPGCLEGRGFDECGEHGFVVLTIDEERHEIEHQFVPFASRKLFAVSVDITNCENTADILDTMRQRLKEEDIEAKHLVKVELVGAVDAGCEKNIEVLTAQFAASYYYFRIKDKSVYRVDYAQYEKDKSLKGEFIRTVMEKEELSAEEKAAIIHYGMQALAGEEIGEA